MSISVLFSQLQTLMYLRGKDRERISAIVYTRQNATMTNAMKPLIQPAFLLLLQHSSYLKLQLAETPHKLHNTTFYALPPHAVDTITPPRRCIPSDLFRRCPLPRTCTSGRDPLVRVLRVCAGTGW